MSKYHLFFSYRRVDLSLAAPLLDALTEVLGPMEEGWKPYFIDKDDIDDHEYISDAILEAIESSKAMLAFYSKRYQESRYCELELLTAWLASQGEGAKNIPIRIILENPESGIEHIPSLLAKIKFSNWPTDPNDKGSFRRLAETIRDHLKGLDGTLKKRPSAPTWFGMHRPSRSARFRGRVEQLWDIHGKLTADRHPMLDEQQGAATAHITGMPGNGKSFLAQEYAIRFGPAFPGGVFWVRARGHGSSQDGANQGSRFEDLLDQLRSLAVEAGLGLSTAELDRDKIYESFWKKMETRESFLWIVDDLFICPDAQDGRRGQEEFRRWLVQRGNGATLLTQRDGRHSSERVQIVDLNVLDKNSSLWLITRGQTPPDALQLEAAQAIVDEIGQHPLASDVAGAYLERKSRTYSQYLEQLIRSDRQQDILEASASAIKSDLPTGHDKSILRTFRTSIQLLSADAMDLLRLAAVLAVAPIPKDLAANTLSSAFPNASADPIDHFTATLDELITLSLARLTDDEGNFEVHVLISRTIRALLGESDARMQCLRDTAVRELNKMFPSFVVSDYRRYPQIAQLAVHARQLAPFEREEPDVFSLGAKVNFLERAADQIEAEGENHTVYFDEGGRFVETLTKGFAEQQGPRRIAKDPRHPGADLATLSMAQLRLMETNADERLKDLIGAEIGARHSQTFLQAHMRSDGPDSPGTLFAMVRLANPLSKLTIADKERALELRKSVLICWRKNPGPDHRDTEQLIVLTIDLLRELRLFEEAHELQIELVEIRKRGLGMDEWLTLASLITLADCKRYLNKFDEADALETSTLERASRGPYHAKVNEHRIGLAWNFVSFLRMHTEQIRNSGRPEEAFNLQRFLLGLSLRLLGEGHIVTLSVMHSLGFSLYQMRQFEIARDIQQSALALMQGLPSPGHPDVLSIMSCLALTLWQLHDDRAFELAQRAYSESMRINGPLHALTQAASANLQQITTIQPDSKTGTP